MQIMQSVAYAPEGGQHAPWAIEVCLEQLDALLQRLFGKSPMSTIDSAGKLVYIYIHSRFV